MQEGLSWIYNVLLAPRHHYSDQYDQIRARVTLIFGAFIAASAVLSLVGIFVAQGTSSINTTVVGSLAALFFCLVAISFVQNGQVHIAALMFTLLLGAVSVAVMVDGVGSSYLVLLVLLTLYTSLIWQWRGVIPVSLLQVVLIIGTAILQYRGVITPAISLAQQQIAPQAVQLLVILLLISIVSGASAFELQAALRRSIALAMRLRAAAEISQQTMALMGNLNELLDRTAGYIRDRFAYYHVQIFLVDNERRFANLVASTGDLGKFLLRRSYRLAANSQSAVGQVIATGEAIVTSLGESADIDSTLNRRANELLSAARSELALPLIVEDQVMGVLDVHSTRRQAFTQDDIDSLEIIASQVSAAIQNAQLFEKQKEALSETRHMFLDAESTLREYQQMNQRLTGQAWGEFTRTRIGGLIGYTLVDNRLQPDTTWTSGLEQAALGRRPVISTDKDRKTVAVPIELRGQTVGAIEVVLDSEAHPTDTLDMIQSVAQRLALSVDNARLFEQTQELAQQELEVNTISTRIQGLTDTDDLVRTVVQEMSRALGAERATVRLGAPAGLGPGGNSNGARRG